MADLTLDIPDELLAAIAARAAEIVLATSSTGGGPHGYLDTTGAAEFLACSTSRIYSLVSARRIPHHHDGSRLLFDRQELTDYVAAGGARRP